MSVSETPAEFYKSIIKDLDRWPNCNEGCDNIFGGVLVCEEITEDFKTYERKTFGTCFASIVDCVYDKRGGKTERLGKGKCNETDTEIFPSKSSLLTSTPDINISPTFSTLHHSEIPAELYKSVISDLRKWPECNAGCDDEVVLVCEEITEDFITYERKTMSSCFAYIVDCVYDRRGGRTERLGKGKCIETEADITLSTSSFLTSTLDIDIPSPTFPTSLHTSLPPPNITSASASISPFADSGNGVVDTWNDVLATTISYEAADAWIDLLIATAFLVVGLGWVVGIVCLCRHIRGRARTAARPPQELESNHAENEEVEDDLNVEDV